MHGLAASSGSADGALHIAIGIATTGRRDILRDVFPYMLRQHRLPDEVIICAADKNDVDPAALDQSGLPVRVLFSERGLCRQRNQSQRAGAMVRRVRSSCAHLVRSWRQLDVRVSSKFWER